MLQHTYSSAKIPLRVVVLGGGGFIGSAVLARLGPEVETLSLGRSSVDLLAPDAGSRLAKLLRPTDVLFFASAMAPCKNAQMLRDNILMLEAVCAALKLQPVAQVIYLSSDAVYKDSMEPLAESSCAEPSSIHGVMHLAREVALRQEFTGLLAIVRPTLVYGLKDPHNGYGPNRFSRLAASGQDIVLFGDGEERRDHVDVEDVAELVRLIAVHGSSGVVNAVSGELASFRELAEFAAAEFTPHVAVKSSPRSGPMPHNGYRPLSNQTALLSFPGFHFKSWREGLARMHARRKEELSQ